MCREAFAAWFPMIQHQMALFSLECQPITSKAFVPNLPANCVCQAIADTGIQHTWMQLESSGTHLKLATPIVFASKSCTILVNQESCGCLICLCAYCIDAQCHFRMLGSETGCLQSFRQCQPCHELRCPCSAKGRFANGSGRIR